MEDYVITISRTFGSGGKSIALDLADKLGINCYNAEIKKTAYEQMGSDIFDLSTRRHRLMGPDAKSFEPDDDLFERQAKIIKNLAESESCIIVGRCADRVLDGYPNVFRFFVDAPFEYVGIVVAQGFEGFQYGSLDSGDDVVELSCDGQVSG